MKENLIYKDGNTVNGTKFFVSERSIVDPVATITFYKSEESAVNDGKDWLEVQPRINLIKYKLKTA
jgi:hypothetical protein